jgi:hypothetical protein
MAGEFKENCQYWYFVQKIGANFKSFNFPNLHVNSCAEINCAKTSCVLNLSINGFAAQYLKFWHEAFLRAFSFAFLSHFSGNFSRWKSNLFLNSTFESQKDTNKKGFFTFEEFFQIYSLKIGSRRSASKSARGG